MQWQKRRANNVYYCSLSGKCPWALFHNLQYLHTRALIPGIENTYFHMVVFSVTPENRYLGAYPRVSAYVGYYGINTTNYINGRCLSSYSSPVGYIGIMHVALLTTTGSLSTSVYLCWWGSALASKYTMPETVEQSKPSWPLQPCFYLRYSLAPVCLHSMAVPVVCILNNPG